MTAKKARKSKKAPSAKQIAARRKFALAAKSRSKAAKAKRPAKKTVKKNPSRPQMAILEKAKAIIQRDAFAAGRGEARPYGTTMSLSQLEAAEDKILDAIESTHTLSQKTPQESARLIKAALPVARRVIANARKRNGKTIIKAKRVTILNLKKNPAFAIHKTLKPTKRGNQAGWLLGTKFYAKSRGQKALPGGSVLDLNSGLVYSRVENPKKSLVGKVFKFAGDKTHFKVVKEYKAAGFIPSVTGHTLDGKKQVNARIADIVWVKTTRKKNIAGFMADGVFHPIRSGIEQRTTKSGVRRVKSKKAYKPSKVGEKRTYSAKKAAKRGVQSKRMTAATKQRKATTTRLASRSLDRSGPKAKRRNPSVEQKLQEWRGRPKDRDSVLIAPDGTPSPLYQLGPLQDLKVEGYGPRDFRIEKPGAIWVCADAKGKIHFATKSGVPMTNLPAGPIGKVKRIDYGPVHKTQFYDKAEEFTHNFGEENGKRPTLYSDGKGGLLLKGGDYYITYRGIQN